MLEAEDLGQLYLVEQVAGVKGLVQRVHARGQGGVAGAPCAVSEIVEEDGVLVGVRGLEAVPVLLPDFAAAMLEACARLAKRRIQVEPPAVGEEGRELGRDVVSQPFHPNSQRASGTPRSSM
jgi:hypothetical protein